ncbi:DUF885 domain-containing protein [Streptomyces sp. NBC_00582]|uniref:DUF885 domain-containing protein n=1 Tax=Streptomyces sp. NBC_00582 TaxID=2975783 RepID=UPI0010636912|nr:DUF885 domain-containing protein [Streptomyces sp. NBC_00582]WUB63937.1 DUF885 domain-containing protein [Streptomyces sp. NBC_00582]
MSAGSRAVREVADAYVTGLAGVDPGIATYLGAPVGREEMPDLSPEGRARMDDLSRATLRDLDRAEQAGGPLAAVERRCGRLLRERLGADLAVSADDEYLREIVNVFGLQQRAQDIFQLMPTATADDWAAVARRMNRVSWMLDGFRESLTRALQKDGFVAAPRQVRVVADQLDAWIRDHDGRGWHAGFCADADVPAPLRAELDGAAGRAVAALAGLRDWLRADYLPDAEAQPDGVGVDRYRTWARFWTGADLDLHETYAWAWGEYRRIRAEMRAEAEAVLPGATPREAMRHLDLHGEAVDGVEEVRLRLQSWMDEALDALDGTHFELAPPVRVVEAAIAPAGTGSAAYYTPPSVDFSRPGRTWLPTQGRTRFPLWSLRSVWFHEGVPGHHLQLAQWRHLKDRLSTYQAGLGAVDACTEGWAMYAERLMDELGHLRTPGERLGFLDWQMLRAVRVLIDIGAHLTLDLPKDSPVGAGLAWTPELAKEFLAVHSGQSAAFVDSEIGRYLGLPGQAIAYKLGERAWLDGRSAARAAHAARGERLDLKSWHTAALSLGPLGLDDLQDELSRL